MGTVRGRTIARHKAKLLGILQLTLAIIALPVAILLVVLFARIFEAAWLAHAIFWGTLLFAIWMIFHILEKYKKKYLTKAGYGIKALEEMGAEVKLYPDNTARAILTLRDRKVFTNISIKREKEEKILGIIPTDFFSAFFYTRICVDHRGKIPCVVHGLALGEKRFYDKDAYLEWIRVHGQDEKIPKKAEVSKELVRKVSEWVKPILDDMNVAALGGVIRIEPNQVLWWRKGGWLPQELLEKAVNLLVGVAEKIETQH